MSTQYKFSFRPSALGEDRLHPADVDLSIQRVRLELVGDYLTYAPGGGVRQAILQDESRALQPVPTPRRHGLFNLKRSAR